MRSRSSPERRRPSRLPRATRLGASAASIAMLVLWGRASWAQDFDQPRPPPAEASPPRAPVLTRPPVVKREPAPVYPPEALATGLTADVTTSIDLDAEGHVTDAAVIHPVGNGFDEAALAAVRAMEFTPAEIDGRPAAIRVEYTLHFRPVTAPPPPPPAPSPPPRAPSPPPVAVILHGRIREKGTREPIAGAAVLLIRRQGGPGGEDSRAEEVATSDSEGRFDVRVTLGPTGQTGSPGPNTVADAVGTVGTASDAHGVRGVRVMVSDSAHEPCLRDLSSDELVAALARPADWSCFVAATNTGFETRVHATRATGEVERHTLTQSELTTVPGTYGDPLRVIQNLPGVARVPYGLGVLVVRGAPPTDTGVFVSGQGIPQLFHFLVGPSVVAPHLIERVDFYPGGFGVRYGRFSGGAVDVILKEGRTEHVHGGVDVSVLDVSAYAEGPLGSGASETSSTSATVAVRRSTIDAILPHVIPQRQGSTFVTVVPVYWDYQARVVKELGSWGRAGIIAFGSDDSLKVVTQDPQAGNFSLSTHAHFHRVVGFWTGQLAGWSARLSPAYGNGEDSFVLGGGNGSIRYQRLYLRADFSRPVGRSFEARLGLDGLFSYDTAYFDSWFPREGRNFGTSALERVQATRHLVDWGPAAFLEGEWRPLSGRAALRIVPGLRFDHYHVIDTDKVSFDPRLTVRWQPNDTWTVKGGAGIYHQLPVGQFLDREFGNPNLALIWSDQYHLGVERPLTRGLNLDATAYFLRRHDLPIPSAERFSSIGRGRAWGLELWLKHDVTAHFFGWLAYTLSWSEQTGSSGEEMVSGTAGTPMASDNRSYHPSPFDQRHNLIAVASYRRGGWQLGGRYRLVSGRPTTSISGSFYDSDFGGYTPQATAVWERLPTFNQLDLRVERTFTFNLWTLGLYLDVQNIFNAQNPESFIYDYRYQQRAPVRGLPILPVLGVRGRF